MLHQIKAPQFDTNFLKFISLVMQSSISKIIKGLHCTYSSAEITGRNVSFGWVMVIGRQFTNEPRHVLSNNVEFRQEPVQPSFKLRNPK